MNIKQIASTSLYAGIATVFLAAYAGAGIFAIHIGAVMGLMTFLVLASTVEG